MKVLAFLALATTAFAQYVPIVSQGAEWKYSATGADPGPAWSGVAFDDAAWPVGVAEIGYGDGDEVTIIAPPPGTVTTYYRHSFFVPNPALYGGLRVRLKCDDGAVVWLNGVPQILTNFPAGMPAANTPAGIAISGAAETLETTYTLSASALVSGPNVLAVEVHQAANDEGDSSFRLALEGAVPANLTRGPYMNSGTPTSVIIRWRTDVPAVSVVNFGTAPNALTGIVNDPVETTEHTVTLTGLTPDTRHYYSIADAAHVLTGGDIETFFDTAPPAGTVKPTRIWVLGDCGTSGGSMLSSARRVANAYKNSPHFLHPDVWLMLGDNAYGSGTDGEYQAAVFNTYADFLRNCVLWSTMGNHETYNGLDPLPYYDIFNFPINGEAGGVPSGSEHYYSFDRANIHFVCLDSMTDDLRSPNSDMAAWLAADLAATTQKWIVAFYHHPPYTKGTHDSDFEYEHIEMRENIQPILEAGGVDLVLGGHSHSYERSCFLDGHYGISSTLTPAMKIDAGNGRESGTGIYGKDPGAHHGTVYTVAGHSGQAGGGYGLAHPVNVIGLAVMGSMFIDVDGDRLDAKMIDINGVIRDSFTISKAPLISVASSTASVGENTGAPVQITVSRTRGLDQAWTVPLALSGTAASGSDFTGAPATVTLGVGVPSVSFSVVPLADSIPEGTETATVAAESGTLWRTSTVASRAAFSLIDAPMQDWLFANFGEDADNPGIAGLLADPDGDGIPNLLERAFGQSPWSPSADASPKLGTDSGYLSLEYFEAADTADLTYTVQWSSDLITWNDEDTVELERTPQANGTCVRVRNTLPVSAAPRRFLRLEVR
jgi:hypothetical protein